MREVIWIRRLALIGAILCFGVVVLGGYTRLSEFRPRLPGLAGLLRTRRAHRQRGALRDAPPTCARPGWR